MLGLFLAVSGAVCLVISLSKLSEEYQKPAWMKRPTDVKTYPPQVRQQIAAAEAQVKVLIDEQAAALDKLGFQVPEIEQWFSYEAAKQEQFRYIVTARPTFTSPDYLTFTIHPQVLFVVQGQEQFVAQAEADFTRYGLPYVMQHYRGAWLQGDPYAFYKNADKGLYRVTPPACAKPYTPADIQKMIDGAKFLASFNPDLTALTEQLRHPDLFLKHPFPSGLPQEVIESGHDEIIIGTKEDYRFRLPVYLPLSGRDRHLYMVGKSGSGKSTLLFNIARQDIERGEGVCVIDPHGDLAEDLLHYIPENRIADTIYFNAAETKYPIGLNILNAQNEEEIGLLADDLLVTFRRLSDSWGERMENLLRFTIHTLLRMEDATFLDIQNILQDPTFRAEALKQIKEKSILAFWQFQFPQLAKDAGQPILNRMSKFALSTPLSLILSQAEATLNFYDVIQNKKVLLVNLAKGKIGEDNAKLLGSIIVSQLQLSIMRRANLAKELRAPYYLYVDEFQNFTTSAFQTILSEARKYQLCLTLAHQYISQLDDQTKHAILGNVGTITVFPLGEKDASSLKYELGGFLPEHIAQLSIQKHEAFFRPVTGGRDTVKIYTLPPPKNSSPLPMKLLNTPEKIILRPARPSLLQPAPRKQKSKQ